MMDRCESLTAEFHDINESCALFRRAFPIAPTVHIGYGFTIFIFTLYPPEGSEAIRKMTEDMKGGNGENCTLFDFDRIDAGFETCCSLIFVRFHFSYILLLL